MGIGPSAAPYRLYPSGIAAAGLLAAVALACAPAWLWAFNAWGAPGYSSAGRWAFVAALTIMFLICLRRRESSFNHAWLAGTGLALAAFGIYFHDLPRPASCLLAALGLSMAWLAACPSERGERWGLAALIVLALPMGVGVDYIAGYPLRILVTQIASLVLGPSVQPFGTTLVGPAGTVLVDAPCAGVRMLGVGLMLAAALAALLRAGFLNTLLLLAGSVLLTVMGNVTRAICLYFIETGDMASILTHDAVGIVIFACSVCTLVMAGFALPRWRLAWKPRLNLPFGAIASISLFVGSLLAVTLPWNGAASAGPLPTARGGEQWPQTWHGIRLHPLPPQPGMEAFLADFPGAIREFQWGDTGKRVLLRTVDGATRALHPSQLCFTSFGWKCTPRGAQADDLGNLWSSFEALRGGENRRVFEAYFSIPEGAFPLELDSLIAESRCWPDSASWYWAAALPGGNVPRTLAITVSEPSGSV